MLTENHATATPPSPVTMAAPLYPIELTVNGTRHQFEIETWVTLLDLLRERMLLTGSKKGCDHGQCGACTVLSNGRRINACLALAVSQNGHEITTIEGLADGNQLHPLQQAFIDHDALQCGYCTPGQICSAVGLMREGEAHTTAGVRELMSGNVCRCGAYPQIVQAVSQVMGIAPAAQPEAPVRPTVVGTVLS
ncbi:(2Fe-2S)-binding protein [Amantichitinum ursilacus]|uniref:Caffeine dehydrogenase subunit gamma n=1 Tax=Amantichitinum ursilacus TaxID=857265 RepID=A0A0N1JRU9_9NEIS|nr:(2Fe-2S)-binding protein [Amantichitinum ursilacus]KPC49640.1 Caffeine dehydrogenase subunit gamma [Amantichitinum ursilacus]